MVELFSIAGLAIAVAVSMVWSGVLHRLWKTIEAMERLPSHRLSTPQKKPYVSVVVAARNEESNIRHAIDSLLNQENVRIEVIAVDDGSTDETKTILEEMAKSDERLLVISNKKVPVGWLGKNYALETGQGRSNGDYILFTDADVIHGRHAVQHAVDVMDERSLDHLALHPRLQANSLVEGIILPFYSMLCEFRFVDPRAAHSSSGVGAGVGAFNLVRAESYRLRGTHARIRGAILDDRALGKVMREDDGRGSVMRAFSQVRMRPYSNFAGLYEGIRKGALSSCGHSSLLTLLMGLFVIFSSVVPVLLILVSGPLAYQGYVPWLFFPALVAYVCPIVAILRATSLIRFYRGLAILYPLGACVLGVAAIHAAFVFRAKGTVEWRGRQYTKRDLIEIGR